MMSPINRKRLLHCRARASIRCPDCLAARQQLPRLGTDPAPREPRGTGYRISTVGACRDPPSPGASITSARPITAASGNAAASDLPAINRSGSSCSCSQANNFPVRPNPVCTSSAMTRDAKPPGHRSELGQEPERGRHDKAAFAQHRLDDHRGEGQVDGSACLWKNGSSALTQAKAQSGWLLRQRAAIAVGVRHQVNIRCVRAEPHLVRGDLAVVSDSAISVRP